jgi:predicted phage terminase large subunit-like protein
MSMDSVDKEAALYVAARRSLYWFVQLGFEVLEPGQEYLDSWHVETICWHLQQLYEGNNRRQIINIYPRSLKSFIASVCFPAWVLGRNPGAKFLCISYGEDLSKDLSLKSKQLMQSALYTTLFPHTKLADIENTATKFWTTANGYRQATTVAGATTGFGADFIVVDDPIKGTDANSAHILEKTSKAFAESILTRLNNPKKGVIAVVMQRLHPNDLTGHLLEHGGWELLRIPARAEQLEHYQRYNDVYHRQPGELLQPALLGETELKERRMVMGSVAFETQYQQNPLPPGGTIFLWEWFKFYRKPPTAEFVIQSYDTATSSSTSADYTVCQTWVITGGCMFIVDLQRFRGSHVELLKRAELLEERHKPDAIICEGVGSGIPFYQEMRATFGKRVFCDAPRIEKAVRALAVTPVLERGKVYLPAEAAWLPEFRAEILSFGNGKHDDQVDCMVQFIRWAPILLEKIKNLGLSQAFRRNTDPEGSPPPADAPAPPQRRLRSIYGLDSDVARHFGKGW